jgi:hypothetical protein
MQVSARSFLWMPELSEPQMTEGGYLFAMTYCGAEKTDPSTGWRLSTTSAPTPRS